MSLKSSKQRKEERNTRTWLVPPVLAETQTYTRKSINSCRVDSFTIQTILIENQPIHQDSV